MATKVMGTGGTTMVDEDSDIPSGPPGTGAVGGNGNGTGAGRGGSGWASTGGTLLAGSPSSGVRSTLQVVDEVAGEALPGSGPAETGAEAAEGHEEVSTEGSESEGESVEAEAGALAAAVAESEAAFSDLRGVEGFAEVGADGPVRPEVLPDAGSAVEGSPEFLPILAGLAAKVLPMLASTFAPMLAKAVLPKLSPPARQVLQRRATAPGGDLIAMLARLLAAAQKKGESGQEAEQEAVDEATVAEVVASIEVIIGTDDRVRITNTTRIPWRRYCALRIRMPSGATYRGTGFFIGPRTLATAGHCVFLRDQGGWARSVEVIPAANGPDRPVGAAVATRFRSTRGWVENRRPAADYGAVVLPDGAFAGRQIGSFGFGALDASTLLAKQAVLAGYPGDKPFAELWGMARRIRTVTPETLTYDNDSMPGQSGAPVYVKQNGKRVVVGIHNYGAASGNSATRITPPVFNNLLAWSRL